MAIMTRLPFSGSSNGRGITITTSDPGYVIHTVSTATGVKDTVYLWAVNVASETRELSVQFGGTASRDLVIASIPGRDGAYGIIPGWTLVGATGVVVYAYGTSTGSWVIYGYVDRAV